jgi:hypothetical protein
MVETRVRERLRLPGERPLGGLCVTVVHGVETSSAMRGITASQRMGALEHRGEFMIPVRSVCSLFVLRQCRRGTDTHRHHGRALPRLATRWSDLPTDRRGSSFHSRLPSSRLRRHPLLTRHVDTVARALPMACGICTVTGAPGRAMLGSAGPGRAAPTATTQVASVRSGTRDGPHS